ncbi:MAG: helix-turn-helix domain-containing protein [Reichenbachiella sp.]|uniref:helix-turn-helix domain-containing protein n=1 Tax=Reichenbachiella sp. TaxID=2184521 RepID=UPI003264C0BB
MVVIHDLTLLLNAIFFGLSVFISLILWFQNTIYKLSNRILVILLLAFSITTFNTLIRLSHYIDKLNFFQDISNSVLLTMGPSIYLFIKLRTSTLSNSRIAIHYLPFGVYLTLQILYYLFPEINGVELVNNVAFLTFVTQWLVYISVSYSAVTSYERSTKENFSNLEKHGIGWVKIVLMLLLITLALRMAFYVYSVSIQEVEDIISLNLTLMFAIITCYLGFKIFRHPEIFIQLPSYSSSNLSNEDLQGHKKKIEQVMVEQCLYLNPKLTLSDLADQAKLSGRVVSQTLNQAMDQNFFDFVNRYRVEALMEKLKSPQAANYKLYVLMEESGFQSPSVAYSAFKKVAGTTPAQYRKAINHPQKLECPTRKVQIAIFFSI